MPGESISLTPDLPGASSLVLHKLTYCFLLTSSVVLYLVVSQHPRHRFFFFQNFLPRLLNLLTLTYSLLLTHMVRRSNLSFRDSTNCRILASVSFDRVT